MLCFHGMTFKAYQAWKNGHGKESVISPWMCSDNDGLTYLHTIEHAQNELNSDDTEECKAYSIQQAKESAIIQCAVNADVAVIVFCLDVPDDMLAVDNSCENMEFCRCISNDEFNQIAVNAEILQFEVNPYFHVFRLAAFVHNTQFNWGSLGSALFEACQIIADTDYSGFYDALYE